MKASYLKLLVQIHEAIRPKTYVEIGVGSGRSLACALPETKAVAIDPEPLPFTHDVRCSYSLFETTSDEFFSRHDLRDLLGAVELAFIDGMHLFEYVLRDLMNLERQGAETVLIHDCEALDELASSRTRTTETWTGDVWKIIPIIREYRPDLDLTVVKVEPSGLAVVTGLDQSSTVLADAYDEIYERFRPIDPGAKKPGAARDGPVR